MALLFTPVGQRGSGAARFAAAMYFYKRQRMTAEMLELYRRCCKLDGEDPVALAQFEGLSGFPVSLT
jgi:hypothetical protein